MSLSYEESATYGEILEFLESYKDIDANTIKEKLRAKRKELGLTPKFFETKAGIPSQQYQHFEKKSNKYKPSLETLIKICYAMGISLLELMQTEAEEE